jgi:hypothetical protein
MEINSSLLNDKHFKFLKSNIAEVSKQDNNQKFRVSLIEYINDTSDNNDDVFFYEMLEFVRFLDPSSDSVAYTTPDRLIYLNSPGKIGKEFRQWDFVYCHECLHQLWETFNVADEIKKQKNIEYDHYILNVASDCVINDYLYTYRKKTRPSNLITPEYIKESYGIEYNRLEDNQFSLYCKLIAVKEKLKNDKKLQQMMNDMDDNADNASQGGQQNGSSSSQQNSSKQSNQNGQSDDESLTADNAQKAADEAKKHAEGAQKQADSNKAERDAGKTPACDPKESQEHADKAKDAAKRAQEAADKAKECADKGDKEGEEKHTKEAQDAANEAKKESLASGGKDTEDLNNDSSEDKSNSDGPNKDKSKGNGNNSDNITNIETKQDLDEIRNRANNILKKHQSRLTGAIGEFISKIKDAKQMKMPKSKMGIDAKNGNGSWNAELEAVVKSFVKSQIAHKKRILQNSYKRVKRGTGPIEFSPNKINLLEPGRIPKKNKMAINVAFYIDRSYSMNDCIDDVFTACYDICEELRKKFSKEALVENIDYRIFAFNKYMTEIKFGDKVNAAGGTMDFDEIIDFMIENTDKFLINIIITDADFKIPTAEVNTMIKKIDGLVVFITNNEKREVKNMAKNTHKLHYILANKDFTIG